MRKPKMRNTYMELTKSFRYQPLHAPRGGFAVWILVNILLTPLGTAYAQQGNSQEASKPVSEQEIVEMLKKGTLKPDEIGSAVCSIKASFNMTEDIEREFRQAGADDQLILRLKGCVPPPPPPQLPPPPARIVVTTSPQAQVYLDDAFRGLASPQGELVIENLARGDHRLRVHLDGKKESERGINIAAEQVYPVPMPLEDMPASLQVRTEPGASLWMDSANRGTVDANGEFALAEVPRGGHTLRIAAPGKIDRVLSVNVIPGVKTPVEVVLIDRVQVNPKDGLKYAWVPPGTFAMGCSPGDNDCASSENPPHQVTLTKGFWMGQTEVPVGAYISYTTATRQKMPSHAPRIYDGWANANLPIVSVTWYEASQYCAWAGGRLPTEAEWEYAARGGTLRARYGSLDEIAWYKDDSAGRTHEVAAKVPNPFFLFDMLGNVWEWVQDWYDPNYYQNSPAQDPPGPSTGQQRSLRGGSWIIDPWMVRVSDRYSLSPGANSNFFGFRCVVECPNNLQACMGAPTSGEIIWTGDVNGTQLITIDKDHADVGTLQGSLPGVVCIIQPLDEKHVSVVSTPGSENNFNRLVLRVKGRGGMREVVKWSLQ